jgi:hypothetical protein
LNNTHRLLLDINLDELDVGVLGLKLGKVGANKLARAAPSCPVVDDDGLLAVDLAVSNDHACHLLTRAVNSSLDSIALTMLIDERERWSGCKDLLR